MPYKLTHFPYRGVGVDGDNFSVPNIGGDVVLYTANGVLKVGDIVYVDAANRVTKSNTQADYATFAGVVVGSLVDFDGSIVGDTTALIGTALTSGAIVYVQINGIAYVVADAALTVAKRVGQGAVTAGRVDDTAFTAGQMAGISLQAATNPGDVIAMQIQPK